MRSRRDKNKTKAFNLRLQNEQVTSGLRKTGLFRTDAEVVDAALRCLVDKLKKDLAEATLTKDLPKEAAGLAPLPDGTQASPDQPQQPELPFSSQKELDALIALATKPKAADVDLIAGDRPHQSETGLSVGYPADKGVQIS